MNILQNRIDSFKKNTIKWPHTGKKYPKVDSFAKAGFYFVRRPKVADTVRCFICNLDCSDWKPGQSPFARHAKDSPDCAWKCLNYPDFNVRKALPIDPRDPNTAPRGSKMRNVRLATFNNHNYWPPNKCTLTRNKKCQPAAQLSDAGFYFAPTATHPTRIKCPYCKVEILEPDSSSNMITKHQELSLNCPFFDQTRNMRTSRSRRNTVDSTKSDDTFKTALSDLEEELSHIEISEPSTAEVPEASKSTAEELKARGSSEVITIEDSLIDAEPQRIIIRPPKYPKSVKEKMANATNSKSAKATTLITSTATNRRGEATTTKKNTDSVLIGKGTATKTTKAPVTKRKRETVKEEAAISSLENPARALSIDLDLDIPETKLKIVKRRRISDSLEDKAAVPSLGSSKRKHEESKDRNTKISRQRKTDEETPNDDSFWNIEKTFAPSTVRKPAITFGKKPTARHAVNRLIASSARRGDPNSVDIFANLKSSLIVRPGENSPITKRSSNEIVKTIKPVTDKIINSKKLSKEKPDEVIVKSTVSRKRIPSKSNTPKTPASSGTKSAPLKLVVEIPFSSQSSSQSSQSSSSTNTLKKTTTDTLQGAENVDPAPVAEHPYRDKGKGRAVEFNFTPQIPPTLALKKPLSLSKSKKPAIETRPGNKLRSSSSTESLEKDIQGSPSVTTKPTFEFTPSSYVPLKKQSRLSSTSSLSSSSKLDAFFTEGEKIPGSSINTKKEILDTIKEDESFIFSPSFKEGDQAQSSAPSSSNSEPDARPFLGEELTPKPTNNNDLAPMNKKLDTIMEDGSLQKDMQESGPFLSSSQSSSSKPDRPFLNEEFTARIIIETDSSNFKEEKINTKKDDETSTVPVQSLSASKRSPSPESSTRKRSASSVAQPREKTPSPAPQSRKTSSSSVTNRARSPIRQPLINRTPSPPPFSPRTAAKRINFIQSTPTLASGNRMVSAFDIFGDSPLSPIRPIGKPDHLDQFHALQYTPVISGRTRTVIMTDEEDGTPQRIQKISPPKSPTITTRKMLSISDGTVDEPSLLPVLDINMVPPPTVLDMEIISATMVSKEIRAMTVGSYLEHIVVDKNVGKLQDYGLNKIQMIEERSNKIKMALLSSASNYDRKE